MVDKYEISLWEDYPDTTSSGVPFLNERKLCVIGSDTMNTQIRAVEPKMVENINGTHTFTFKMYYVYRDEETGEMIPNPFGSLLINERKVKVLWKGNWYDLLIKQLDEDTASKSITYTCKDTFITELSKNGYNLEFSSELQNNIGTSKELAAAVLKDSGWQFDSAGSYTSIQKTEEAVYETSAQNAFTATKQSPNGDTSVTIPKGANVLVFYSSIIDINSATRITKQIQFLYAAGGYQTEDNGMLVLNGDCYAVSLTGYKTGDNVILSSGNTTVLTINVANAVSGRYRAERLVKSQITKYDALFDRFVNVYSDTQSSGAETWGYETTEYSDPLTVVNLAANSSNFSNLDGWIGANLSWGIYPKFTSSTDISSYTAKSYLRIGAAGSYYNNGISANQQYLKPSQNDIKKGITGGFHIGDRYIFRVKIKANGSDPSTASYLYNTTVTPQVREYSAAHGPTGNQFFSVGSRTTNGQWNEYVLTCNRSLAADQIDKAGLFLVATAACWVEDVEFFKEEFGVTTYGSTTVQRMNPGEISLQGIAQTIYRYYRPDHGGATTPEGVTFLYEDTSPSSRFTARTNNYEKLATIEAKQSNRFNILQSIAEAFECWVRFIINHDENGRVLYDAQGNPQKYVRLVEYVGEDLGWSFEYGIDLKTLKRKIVSDQITTKVIVLPNDNEFAPNGFCTIARSSLNYTRENFVLNLDYFINQGLLDQRTVDRDLYSTSNNYIGYYYNLHMLNKEYDEITDLLVQKRNELSAQQSELTVQQNKLKALNNQLTNTRSDVMTLACVSTWSAAQAYARTHTDNVKVQSLLNTAGSLQNQISKTTSEVNQLVLSVTMITNYINDRVSRQNTIRTQVETLHARFFKKYSRYLQEGTWQDESYIDDNKYYLDAVDVAYTSSRPQLQYEINVMRLTAIEDFSSKKFQVGDLCYIADREYFGYGVDGITPYKLRIVISEITSFFDEPQKDVIKVQNYKTQFDDLFQRITATTQSLQYQQGGFQKAAEAIQPDKTLTFDLLQETFDKNKDIVLNAANQQVTWDGTGITVGDSANSANKLRIMSGGLFISNDGGLTWKNAVRGDGISADVLTAGRINTSQIFVYDGNHPTFRWDSQGINAYYVTGTTPNFGKFVRFDQFGVYGYNGTNDFKPSTEDAIWAANSGVKFGLTWRGFFLRGSSGNSSLEISDNGSGIVFLMKNAIQNNSLEISTSNDIVLKTGTVNRVQIGRLTPSNPNTEYGIWVRDASGNNIFNVSSSGTNSIGGWTLTRNSFYHTVSGTGTIGFYSEGTNATVQGVNKSFYILAGNNFGVTANGEVYASAGKIGGWTINSATLTGGNVTINSNGNISCTTNGSLRWALYNNGDATFHNITADGGTIAGWHITQDEISNQNGTALQSSTYSVNRYTITTNSINASGGSIGGCTLSSGGLSGTGWSLGGSGGSVGGWSISSGSLSSGGITLNSSGSITIGGSSLVAGSKSDITINSNLTVSNWCAIGGTLDVADQIRTLEDVKINGSVLDSDDVDYLHWLSNNWGYTSPESVRRAGIASVYVESCSGFDDGSYNKRTGRTQLSFTINLEGELADGTEVAGRSQDVTYYVPTSDAYDTGVSDGESHFTYVGDKKGDYTRN